MGGRDPIYIYINAKSKTDNKEKKPSEYRASCLKVWVDQESNFKLMKKL